MQIPHHPNSIPKREIARLIGNVAHPLVLEIGCNDGADTRELFDTIGGVNLICFEPDPRPIGRFEKWAAEMAGYTTLHPGLLIDQGERRLRLHRIAIGEIDGTTTLHMSGGTTKGAHLQDWDLSSSIHLPTTHQYQVDPWMNFDRSIPVPVCRLDTLMADWDWPTVDFIWADTQGSEGDMIRGGTETLRRTRYLYSEFYNVPRYEGQPNLSQIMEMLGPHWRIMGFYEGYNFLAQNTALVTR